MIFSKRKINRSKFNPKKEYGFTLVELLIAVGIFTIVMFVAVGALLRIVSANQQAQAMKSVMNNLNFAMETVTRNIRMGTKYHCGDISLSGTTASSLSVRDCPNGGESSIAFVSSAGDLVYYKLHPNGYLERSIKGLSGSSTTLPITASEMKIDRLDFYVSGTASNDNDPSKVRITVGGEAQAGPKIKTRFDLQTYAVQRFRDQ